MTSPSADPLSIVRGQLADADEGTEDILIGIVMQGEQKVRNPCLLQLTTFSLRSARPNGRNLKHAT